MANAESQSASGEFLTDSYEPHVTYAVTSVGVAVITLNRPDRMNAWTRLMAAQLREALQLADTSSNVRAVVLTGAGTAFCAGIDIERFLNPDPSDPPRTPWSQSLLPSGISKPVVAAINGSTVGVGMALAMHCDLRLVEREAKLGFVFNRRGMAPEVGMHQILPRTIGQSRAADLLLSGRIIQGEESVELGVCNRVLDGEQVLAEAIAWAEDVAINCSPASVGATKALLWGTQADVLLPAYDIEDGLGAAFAKAEDSGEGMRAFREKRSARWESDHRSGYSLASSLHRQFNSAENGRQQQE